MRPDAYGIVTAYGSPHLARKAEQVPQGLRDIGSSKRTCPLCSKKQFDIFECFNAKGAFYGSYKINLDVYSESDTWNEVAE